ncbi:MAG: hypothetical protein HRT80_02545 [Henriciella sp.]|nr:hypothetical protein [Henriciella sp.]
MLTPMTPLSALETAAMRAFCQIGDLPLNDLADHIPHLSVTSREHTGVGVFVELNSSLSGMGDAEATISGVIAVTNDERPALGFLLFVKAGKPRMLEGFSYANAWPDDLSDYTVSLE